MKEADQANIGPARTPLWKRIILIAAEVVLVALVITLITAILLPVYKGVSPEGRQQQLRGL